jgi:gliding motility-associated-like protein
MKKFIFLTLAFVLSFMYGYGSHVVGAEMTYRHVTGNKFRFTLKVYRYCSKTPFKSSYNIEYSSLSCGKQGTFQVKVSDPDGIELPINCEGQVTSCSDPSGTPGIKEYEYVGDVDLPQQCSDWVFSFNESNDYRNETISTIENPGQQRLYIEARLNNILASANNSPTFDEKPVSALSINQPNKLNPGTVEIDGDKLVFRTITPRTGKDPKAVVKYVQGYSASSPVTSSPAFSINSENGAIAATPTKEEISITTILVEEYRNGVLIGSIMRDIQLITQDATNINPVISEIDSTTGSGKKTGPRKVEVCSGEPVCVYFSASDVEGQNVSVTSNAGSSLPGSVITYPDQDSSTVPVKICWTAPVNAKGNFPFTITAKDDNCPKTGSLTETFEIFVNASPKVKMPNDTTISCNITIPVKPVITDGTEPFTYKWNTGETTAIINKPAGEYYVNVKDAKGCRFTPSKSPADTTVIKSSIKPLFGHTVNCQAEFIAFWDSSSSSGGAITKWKWDFGDLTTTADVSSLKKPSYKYSGPGVYGVKLEVEDVNGCKASYLDSVRVCDIPEVNFIIKDSCKHKDLKFQDLSKVRFCGIKEYRITTRKIGTIEEKELITYSFDTLNGNDYYYPPKDQLLSRDLTVRDTGLIEFKVYITNEYDCKNEIAKTYRIYDNPWGKCTQDSVVYLKCNSPEVTFKYTPRFYDENGKFEGRPFKVYPGKSEDTLYYNVYWQDGSRADSITVKKPGRYQINIVDSLGCDTAIIREIRYPIKTDFRFTPFCNKEDSRTFIENTESVYPVATYTWNMGTEKEITVNGPGSGDTKYSFTEDKEHLVTLIVKDENGCGDTASYKVKQLTLDKSTFTVTPRNVCSGKSIDFKSPRGADVESIAWYFGTSVNDTIKRYRRKSPLLQSSGGFYQYNHTRNPYGTTNAGKSYNAGVVVIYNLDTLNKTFCRFDTTAAIKILPGFDPKPVVTGGCMGYPTEFKVTKDTAKINLQWTISYVDESHGSGHTHEISKTDSKSSELFLQNEGQYIFDLLATDSNMCNYTSRVIHNVIKMPNPGVCPVNLCENSKTLLMYRCTPNFPESYVDSVRWDFNDHMAAPQDNISFVDEPEHTYKSPGFYNVRVEIWNKTNRCMEDTIVPVFINAQPVPEFTATTPMCSGVPVVITDLSKASEGDTIISRMWTYGDGDTAVFTTGDIHTHLYNNPGFYNITLITTNKTGCSDTTGPRMVEVGPTPVAGFEYDENALLKGIPVSFNNTSVDGVKWYWNYGDGNDATITDPALKHPTHTFAVDSSTVTQIVFNSFGCSDTLIKKLDLKAYLIIPTLFTPNGDGNNDVLSLLYKGIQEILEFRIYNRWGELVYDGTTGNDVEKFKVSWDGTFKGREQPVGTYVWYVKAKTFTGVEYSNSGKVTLVR